MLYGVDFRNELDGRHNIALFEDKNKALEFENLINKAERDGSFDSFEASQQYYADAFELSISVVENINYHNIEKEMELTYQVNKDGMVTTLTDKVEIVNIDNFVSIPY